MIRVVFEYFVKKMTAAGAASNPVAKVAICAARCCLYCLDKCVKFINKTAYIQVALHNKAFCPAAWQGFYLTVRHFGKVSASNMVGLLLVLLGKASIIALNVWFTVLMVRSYEGVRSPVVFCVLVGIIAYIISSLF